MFRNLIMFVFMFLAVPALADDAKNPSVVAPTVEAQAPVASTAVPEATPATTEPVVATPASVEQATASVPQVVVPDNADKAIDQTKDAISAFQVGSWAAGLILMLGVLIFIYNKFIDKKK